MAVEISVEGSPRGYVGIIRTRRQRRSEGERRLDGSTCRELIDAIVMATSIAIDPTVLSRPPVDVPAHDVAVAVDPEPRSAVVQASVPTSEPTGASPPPERRVQVPGPRAEPVHLSAAVGMLGSIGLEPGPTFGLRLEGALRIAQLSIGIGGRADLESTIAVAGGNVSGSILWGEITTCGWVDPFYVCAVGTLGAFQAAGRKLNDSRNVSLLHAGVGGRLGAEVRLIEGLSLRVQGDLLAAVTQTTVLVGDERVWIMSPVSGSIALLLAFHFS